MKTIEAFIKEIEGSEVLQAALKAISDKDALAAFLKQYDVSGTVEDFVKALNATEAPEGELADDEAEAAAGGRIVLPEGVSERFEEMHRARGIKVES